MRISFLFLIGVIILSGRADAKDPYEPSPFSVMRYQKLWTQSIIAKSKKPSGVENSDSGWSVAGVFMFESEPGAVVVHAERGIVEEIGRSTVSPSGIRLIKIFSNSLKTEPKIEVEIQGKRIVLTGIKSKPAVVAKK